ncbi:MAG TPA: hypothetical protein VGK89_06695 [Candidatus Eisenbacteria bacterium]|jgi:hypothetical protein
MNLRHWPILASIGLLGIAPAQARERKTPELDPALGSIAVKIKTIGPGRIAFMGDMVVKVAVGMGKADSAQNHFGDLIGRGNAFVVQYALTQDAPSGPIRGATMEEIRNAVRERSRAPWHFDVQVGVEHMTRAGRMDRLARDAEAERAFWKMAAKKVFPHEPDWQKLAQARLDELH